MTSHTFVRTLRRITIAGLIGLGLTLALSAAGLLVPTPMAAFAGAAELTGQWFVDPGSNGDDVNLQFRFMTPDGSRQSWGGRRVAIAKLAGLDVATVRAGSHAVEFRVARDAGTFACRGTFEDGKGAGTFALTLDQEFASALERRGVGRPTEQELIQLALANAGLELLDELKTRGYGTPHIAEFVTMAAHGVDLDYLRGMAKHGHRFETIAQLIRARDHGVDPRYIESLAKAGYTDLPFDQLLRARDHGVSATYVESMAEAGHKDLELEELIRAHDHGVTVKYVIDMAKAGFENLSLKKLIAARDHGVDGAYVRRARARRSGALTIDDVIGMRNRGD